MAYDDEAIYFAFRCLDAEPEKIKTSVARRDSIFGDDWVGLSLDSQGLRQSSYDLFVNPNGIQADIYDSTTDGGRPRGTGSSTIPKIPTWAGWRAPRRARSSSPASSSA